MPEMVRTHQDYEARPGGAHEIEAVFYLAPDNSYEQCIGWVIRPAGAARYFALHTDGVLVGVYAHTSTDIAVTELALHDQAMYNLGHRHFGIDYPEAERRG